jgi:hypothetical protein
MDNVLVIVITKGLNILSGIKFYFKTMRFAGRAKEVKCLPGKHKALRSNSSTGLFSQKEKSYQCDCVGTSFPDVAGPGFSTLFYRLLSISLCQEGRLLKKFKMGGVGRISDKKEDLTS